MAVILVGRGVTNLGIVHRDADGNVIKEAEPGWHPDPEGSTIAVAEVDPDTMEQKEPAAVFGDWEASLYLRRILDKLGPGRHIPDMAAIIKGAVRDGFNPCVHCTAEGNCRECVITEWKDEVEA